MVAALDAFNADCYIGILPATTSTEEDKFRLGKLLKALDNVEVATRKFRDNPSSTALDELDLATALSNDLIRQYRELRYGDI